MSASNTQTPKASERCFDVEYFYLINKAQRLILSPNLRTLEEAKAYPVTGDISGVACQSVTRFARNEAASEQFKSKIFGKAPEMDITFFVVMRREGNVQDYISPFYETKEQAQVWLDSIECVNDNDKKTFIGRGLIANCENLSNEERGVLLSQLVLAQKNPEL